MLYYKFKVQVKETKSNRIPANREDDFSYWAQELKEKTIAFNNKNEDDPFRLNQFFLFNTLGHNTLTGCIVYGYRCKIKLEDAIAAYVKDMGYEVETIEEITEITIHDFASYAHRADRCGLIQSEDEILDSCSIGSYRLCRSNSYDEYFANETYPLEEAKRDALKTNCNENLIAELDRIYTPREQKTFIGNPVHYILYTDDYDTTKKVAKVLVSALYSNGRLRTRRYAIDDLSATPNSHLSIFDDDADDFLELHERLLHSQKGGTIVIKTQTPSESNQAKRTDFHVEELATLIDRYKVETLSIIVLNKTSKALGDSLKNHLPKVRFVEIEQENFSPSTAIELLKEKASSDGITNTDTLIASLPKDNRIYNIKDINDLYNDWLNDRLCNEVYTQYKSIKRGQFITAKPEGDAYSELQALIGLKSAKELVQQALDFNKAQVLYQRVGLNELKPSRHMVFTGNPGTAKTTVARLFAQILKDNKVLPRGNLVEVGRKDLVGKYVGWTAKLVEEAFLNARGGVLFIDEAYSLCEEKAGLYGDEAINTIVQMMENQRDNTIVIFAGYPDKMQQFLDKNPGLRSRIAFNVNFDNYNTEELVQILQLMASKNNTLLADDVVNKVTPIFNAARLDPAFGNGRYVRNVFEQAKMKQASRLVRLKAEELTDTAIKTLIADDFAIPQNPRPRERHIGFGY